MRDKRNRGINQYPEMRARRCNDPMESFRAKHTVNHETGCWEWTACRDKDGYALLTVAKKIRRAHRWIYIQTNGPLPDGLVIDHLCRNRGCVNPFHMEPVTNKENQIRGHGFPGENARKTHCPQGHELAGENLAKYMLRKGYRSCAVCARERTARRKLERLQRENQEQRQ